MTGKTPLDLPLSNEGGFFYLMYKIIKTKSGKFRVKYYGANGEVLAVSEELETKANAKKNIKAMAKIFV